MYALSCISLEFGAFRNIEWHFTSGSCLHTSIHLSNVLFDFIFRSARRRSRARPTSTAWRTSPAAGRAPGSSRSNAQTNNNSQIIPSIRLLRGIPYVTSIQMGEGIRKRNRQLKIEFCKQRLMGSENPKISWTSYMEDPLY